ncbi:MAG: ATP-binding protein, partial [Actinobacteria bacterium]|nr:ATP-binding protein [Actinomycetota bacterium]
MSAKKTISADDKLLCEQLQYLKLPFILEHYRQEAQSAAQHHLSHVDYLARLIDGEALAHRDHSTERRIKLARFPVIKTMDEFDWSWPRKINRLQIQNLFRLAFIREQVNVIILGSVGLGKTHLCTALGYEACLKGHRVLFASAIDIINTLSAAHNTGQLKKELKKYLRPDVLIMDELGYL